MLSSLPPHQQKPSRYPYESRIARLMDSLHARGIDTSQLEWTRPGVSVAKIIQSTNGPILEIGGPSDLGFYYLDGVELPSPVIISNIAMNTMKYAPNVDDLNSKTEILIDGRDIPTADNTLGMVLSAYMTIADEDNIDMIDEVNAAVRRVAETQIINDEVLRLSLRLGIAHEVFQKLEPGGLYITDCTMDEKTAFTAIGYTPLAYLDSHGIEDLVEGTKQDPYFNVVLQKPITD